MSLAREERAHLADLLAEVGPDRPTLCEGWASRDLLTHLLIRERRPDAAVGLVVGAAHPWYDRVAAGYAAMPWDRRVALFRSGPPWANPMGWPGVEEWTNGAEMFIHHEDLRRGAPGWQPRGLSDATNDELVRLLSGPMTRVMLRHAPVGVVAEMPGRESITLRRGEPAGRVRGEPGEILLWLSGRDAAQVDFAGDAVPLRAMRRGL